MNDPTFDRMQSLYDAADTERRLVEALEPIMPYLLEYGHPDEPEYGDTAIVIRGASAQWITAGDVRRLRAALAAAQAATREAALTVGTRVRVRVNLEVI